MVLILKSFQTRTFGLDLKSYFGQFYPTLPISQFLLLWRKISHIE